MSYEFYKILHVFSALLLFMALGTYAATCRSQGDRFRRLAGISHGVSLAVLFVAGFGLMARLGMFGEIALWAWFKIGLWLLLALATALLRRKPQWAAGLWVALPVLGGLAAWLAVSKPF